MTARTARVDALREQLASGGSPPSVWSNDPGERYAAHRHGFDKVIIATEGSISFLLPATGTSIDLVAGDRLHLPAGTDHAAVVGPAGVTCLEAHRPQGTLGTIPRHLPGGIETDAPPPA